MLKSGFKMDERNKQMALQVTSVIYFLTLIMLTASIAYRQFILHQETSQFDDMAIIMTFNVIFLLSALLYFGGIPVLQIRLRFIFAGYFAFVLIGFLFTYIKYTFLTEQKLSFLQILDKLYIISIICGLLVIFYSFFAYLGRRRIEKELEG